MDTLKEQYFAYLHGFADATEQTRFFRAVSSYKWQPQDFAKGRFFTRYSQVSEECIRDWLIEFCTKRNAR